MFCHWFILSSPVGWVSFFIAGQTYKTYYGFVSSGYNIVYKKVKHETLLIEYNPRVFYGDKVISMILSSGHKNIVIIGLWIP